MRVVLTWLCLTLSGAGAWAQIDATNLLAEARELARAGRHADAITRYERLAAAVEAELGPGAVALVYVLRELAEQHHILGDAAKAEPLYRRVVELGEDNSEVPAATVAAGLRGLAALAAGGGRMAEAEALYRRALAAYDASGAADLDAARTLAELGMLSQLQGRMEESETFYRRAMEVGEASRLPAVELATIVNNLGAVCATRERFEEAESFYRRALAMREAALGANHLQVAFVAEELARLLDRQGRLAEAAPLYERVLRIREAAGERGVTLSDVLQMLGAVYRRQGRTQDAERLFRRSVAIAEEYLGPEHPMVALRLNNLAVLCSEQSRYDEAEALYRRALAIEEKAFGAWHASVAAARMNLASLLYKQDRYDDARAEAIWAREVLDAECADDAGGEFCRQALDVYKELEERLEAASAAAPAARETAAAPPPPAVATRVAPPVAAPAAPPAAAPPPPAAPPAAPPGRVYRAQVASRQDRAEAEAALEELRGSHAALTALPARIARADLGDKGVWYRVQLGVFASGAQAQALCGELAEGGHKGCFVIATRP